MKTGDPAAIREIVSFLRFGGGPDPFPLGDQKRFIKRALAVGDAATLQSILMTNKDLQNRRIIEGVVVIGDKDYQAPADVPSMPAKGHLNDAVVELDVQLSVPSK